MALRRQHRPRFFQESGRDEGISRISRSLSILRQNLHHKTHDRTRGNRSCAASGIGIQRHLFSTTTTRIYAIGEGWTGSFGSGRLDQCIAGHHDDEIEVTDRPLLVYETDQSVTSCAVGWAHSAFIHDQRQLLMTGRPHEFSSLLRLARLPHWIRQYAIQQTHRTVHPNDQASRGFQLTDIVGAPIAILSNIFLQDTDWDAARRQSEMADWTAFDDALLPEPPVHVSCSAGVTAVTTAGGKLFAFGLNSIGQCGTGETSNNVWVPAAVTGLSRADDNADVKVRMILEQSHPVISSALGLQHGLCLNSAGEVYAWGKGNRGQLGYDRIENESLSAVPVHKAVFDLDLTTQRPVYRNLEKVSQVAAGMLHSAALEEESNHVYTWGKHILPPLLDNPASGAASVNNSNNNNRRRYHKASDAHIPVRLRGLPAQLKVLQISCGSHHTSMLLEDGSVWAVGMATDSQQPMFDPVCLLASGVVDGDLPVRYFGAHMDRTTVVTNSGQVFQVHLWEDPANQDVAVFTPAWAHALMADAEDNDAADGGVEQIQSVHRSWLHTLVVTKTVATKKEP